MQRNMFRLRIIYVLCTSTSGKNDERLASSCAISDFVMCYVQAFLRTERGTAARLEDFASALLTAGQKVSDWTSLKV